MNYFLLLKYYQQVNANSFRSSLFVFNSTAHCSSVTLPIESADNLTLYFHSANLFSDEASEDATSMVYLNNVSSNGTDAYWPPKLINYDTSPPSVNSDEWAAWFTFYMLYIEMRIIPDEKPDENKITYYLTSTNDLDTSGLEEGKIPIKLSDDSVWETPSLERNKIIKKAKADLYIYYPKVLTLGKVKITATLLDGNKSIDSVEQELSRTNSLELLQGGPNQATSFEFDIPSDSEISNGHKLSLKVAVTKAPLFTLRNTKLICGADFPSSLYVEFDETTNINVTIEDSELEKYVVPGGSAEYIVNITSEYSDTITLDVLTDELDDVNKWNIGYSSQPIEIKEGGYALKHIFVNSTDDSKSAEDDSISLTFVKKEKKLYLYIYY